MVTGLNTDFALKNGKFELASGSDKAANCLWFFINFEGSRIYMLDYDPALVDLIQRPASYLIQFRTIILSNLQKLIIKYIPQIDVKTIDLIYSFQDRKEYGLFIEYTNPEDIQPVITVKFIG